MGVGSPVAPPRVTLSLVDRIYCPRVARLGQLSPHATEGCILGVEQSWSVLEGFENDPSLERMDCPPRCCLSISGVNLCLVNVPIPGSAQAAMSISRSPRPSQITLRTTRPSGIRRRERIQCCARPRGAGQCQFQGTVTLTLAAQSVYASIDCHSRTPTFISTLTGRAATHASTRTSDPPTR